MSIEEEGGLGSGQSHHFSGKLYIFGQKPAAKKENKYFFVFIKQKNEIHSVQRDEVPEICFS